MSQTRLDRTSIFVLLALALSVGIIVVARARIAATYPVVVSNPTIHLPVLTGTASEDLAIPPTVFRNIGDNEAKVTLVSTNCTCHDVNVDDMKMAVGDWRVVPPGEQVNVYLPMGQPAIFGGMDIVEIAFRVEVAGYEARLVKVSRVVHVYDPIRITPAAVSLDVSRPGSLPIELTVELFLPKEQHPGNVDVIGVRTDDSMKVTDLVQPRWQKDCVGETHCAWAGQLLFMLKSKPTNGASVTRWLEIEATLSDDRGNSQDGLTGQVVLLSSNYPTAE